MAASGRGSAQPKASIFRHLLKANIWLLILPMLVCFILLLTLIFEFHEVSNARLQQSNMLLQEELIRQVESEVLSSVININQDYDLNRTLSRPMNSDYEVLVGKRECETKLLLARNFHSSRNYSISIHTLNGINAYAGPITDENQLTYETISREPWFHDMISSSGQIIYLNPDADSCLRRAVSDARCFAVCKLTNIYSARYLGVIVIAIRDLTLINDRHDEGSTHYLVIDESGRTVSADPGGPDIADWSGYAFYPELMERDGQPMHVRLDGNPVVLRAKREVLGDWSLVAYSVSVGVISYNMWMVILLIVICLLLALLTARYNAGYLERQTRPIVEAIRKTAGGDLRSRMPDSRSAELDLICTSYNKMLRQVEEMIARVEREEHERSKSEIRALRSQINPHFLYNTLASIRFLIADGQGELADQAMIDLVRLLRATFSECREIIPLAEELSFLQAYVSIMKIRYQDEFEYAVTAQEGTQSCGILMWTLQPFVENSITHGFNQKEGVGHIEICVERTADGLLISVMDDGTTENMDRIQRSLMNAEAEEKADKSRFNGIGIGNVQHRLKLHFGEQYGITAQKNPSGGMTFIIRIPIIELPEDQHEDCDRG